ncbi:hypothetical protein [Streptomyces sp. BH105]|uniref:hypothetical protein n=1 Tax=Streptomyces sp. BH105 TaxID=3410408 RepID=UPI003CF53C5E
MPGYYTNGERGSLAFNLLRGMKQAAAGGPDRDVDTVDPKLVRKIGRIRQRAEERAEEREERLDRAEWRLVEKARDKAAEAKAALRIAKGGDRPAARRALRDAESELRRVERRTHYR